VEDDGQEEIIYGETPTLSAWPVSTAGEPDGEPTSAEEPVKVVTLVITKTITKGAEATFDSSV
jgi:hypothetical protein